jgi:hypothetical protein
MQIATEVQKVSSKDPSFPSAENETCARRGSASTR